MASWKLLIFFAASLVAGTPARCSSATIVLVDRLAASPSSSASVEFSSDVSCEEFLFHGACQRSNSYSAFSPSAAIVCRLRSAFVNARLPTSLASSLTF